MTDSSSTPPAPDKIPPIPSGSAPSKPSSTGKQEPAEPTEIGGPKGPEPTRYGDWEVGGRCSDF